MIWPFPVNTSSYAFSEIPSGGIPILRPRSPM
jgi:hypothetical protein